MERVDHCEDRLDGRSLFMLDLGDDDVALLVEILTRRADATKNLYERGLCLEVVRQLEEALAESADTDGAA